MNPPNSRYDSELQMFADQPREVDLAHLRFLRWLGERGRLEHATAGPPAGLYACRPVANAGAPGHPVGQLEAPPMRAEAPNARHLKL